VQPGEIFKRWTNRGTRNGITGSSPDFALSTPFPHKIVFEGKYFRRGSPDTAGSALATGIYQAFFYRALPELQGDRRHPPWKYDYACLLAYDASPEGRLTAAWNLVSSEVRKSFWDSGNIYVMILGGQGQQRREGSPEP
jgi:hypothetical protein